MMNLFDKAGIFNLETFVVEGFELLVFFIILIHIRKHRIQSLMTCMSHRNS